MTTVNVSVVHIKSFLANFEILNRNQKLKEVLKAPHYHSTASLYNTLYYSVSDSLLDIVQSVQIEAQVLPGMLAVINADPLLLDNF